MADSDPVLDADNSIAEGLGLAAPATSQAIPDPDSYVSNLLSDQNNPWLQGSINPDGTINWPQYPQDQLLSTVSIPGWNGVNVVGNPPYPDPAAINSALDAYIAQNPPATDLFAANTNPQPEPPNPWLQGLGSAAASTDALPAYLQPNLPSYLNPPWLNPDAAQNQNSQPTNDSAAIQSGLDAYRASLNAQAMGNPQPPTLLVSNPLTGTASSNLYPSPPTPPTGYEGIVPTPQPPYPTATPNPQPSGMVDYNPPQLATAPIVTTPPNPVDPSLASATNAYYGKLLSGAQVNPYSSNLPQDLNTTLRITNVPNANGSPPTEFSVLASEFAGGSERGHMKSAYPPNNQVNADALGVALPVRFPLPIEKYRIKITNPANGLSVDAPIVDVGPHNTHDPYWTNAARNYRPLSEGQYTQKLPSQLNVIPRNPAGIDLTPATMNALGIKGKENNRTAPVMWRFIPNNQP